MLMIGALKVLSTKYFDWHVILWWGLLILTQVIFKLNLVIDGLGNSWEIALGWMSLDLTNDESTWVHVMVWCRQATSHYMNQYWYITGIEILQFAGKNNFVLI